MRSATVVLLVASLALVGCKKKQRDDAGEATVAADDLVKPRTRALIDDLRAGGGRAARATEHIWKLSAQQALTTADGEAIIDVLPSLPAPGDEEVDLQRLVLEALSQYLLFAWIPRLDELADDLRVDGRVALLEILAGNDNAETITAFVDILDRFPDPVPEDAFDVLQEHTIQANAAFPALFDVLDAHPENADLFFYVMLTAIYYADAGKLPAGALTARTDWLLGLHDNRMAVIAPAQRPRGVAWRYEEPYLYVRSDLGLLLDLFAALPIDVVESRLEAAMRLQDPELVAFAVESWLDHGRTPPAAALELLARSDESRTMLWDDLSARDKLTLFPKKFRNQAALAAGLLARNLRRFPETRRAPDEIELIGRVEADTATDDGMIVVYVFRFRLDDETWYEGWAGPFRTIDGVTTDHPAGFTGTDFTEATGRSASEIYPPLELLTNWRDYRANNPGE